MRIGHLIIMCVVLIYPLDAWAADLLTISDLTYLGAFRVPTSSSGNDDYDYSAAKLGFNPDNGSLYMTTSEGAVGEITIPPLSLSGNYADWNRASNLQLTQKVLDLLSNPNGIDQIGSGGMKYFTGSPPQLIFQVWEYYDAEATTDDTTMRLLDADDLALGTYEGYYKMSGAAHTARWMSDIPPEWQASLGGDILVGSSGGPPIDSRFPIGPSAFAVNSSDFLSPVTPSTPITTMALLDYSITYPIASGWNNLYPNLPPALWTHLARAIYGFIVPGTDTYMVIGNNAGIESGICYKGQPLCPPESCGGYCTVDPTEHYAYYWLFDVNDLAAVKAGSKQPYELQPYEHGKWTSMPFFSTYTSGIGGATFDAANRILYVSRANFEEIGPAKWPVVLAFQIPFQDTHTDLIFADGFESGDTSAWTITTDGP